MVFKIDFNTLIFLTMNLILHNYKEKLKILPKINLKLHSKPQQKFKLQLNLNLKEMNNIFLELTLFSLLHL
jgi:hypothetical protein